ncbi:hypothetical protein NA57DRAFT_32427 [Rhizodiscina lignyota]|uniref:Zn(2)-C6 fungal-type domain-containing protein n=1 Tax=Rhizodiscina lignyota TaxID=1504668 RepID=A0A9P4IP04_9PEZI|nr:hypothetical protein NA57DRAFT_32427 [Rhizodiscina lignyota]
MQPSSFHQQSPIFTHYSPQNVVTQDDQMLSHYSPTHGLDTLAETSHSALQQFHHDRRHYSIPHTAMDSRHHPYQRSISSSHFQRAPSMTQVRTSRSASASGPVRRRISRACDQCNQLRTKCDGKTPCAHCVEFGLTCEYNRERKKRGKASRKEIAAQQAAAAAAVAAAHSGNEEKDSGAGDEEPSPRSQANQTPQDPWSSSRPTVSQPTPVSATSASSTNSRFEQAVGGSSMYGGVTQADDPRSAGSTALNGPYSQQMDQAQAAHSQFQHPSLLSNGENGSTHSGDTPTYGQSQRMPTPLGFRVPTGESPYGFVPSPMAGSPGWLSMPTPSAALYSQTVSNAQQLRYPVLQPLLPYLGSIVPIPVACDLLELYFHSTSSVFTQPQSPYVLGYVFRKRSFLRASNPRVCSPALLSSMLWVGAQTSESAFFTSPPSARGRICQKLLELTVGLLKPLIHTPAPGSELQSPTSAPNTVVNGVALGGLGVTIPQHETTDGGSPGASAALDDVVTYMHLATVVSATEFKMASLRWWNAAWSLCRELKLGRELPPNGSLNNNAPGEGANAGEDRNVEPFGTHTEPAPVFTEEEREERRRIWWLCYTMDRHLALCYNKPLFLLDQECEGLLQPIDDSVWQAGEWFNPDPSQLGEDPSSPQYRRRGPSFECTGHSIFGYFTPLMTVLGEIVDLNHARNHPRFGLRFRTATDWEDQASEITSQLEAYGRSLEELSARYGATKPAEGLSADTEMQHTGTEAETPSGRSVTSTASRVAETILQTKIVVAYGTHLMHTLHILLNGKWDPISLLDDNDLWISSQSFISATGHAVSAAEALSELLEHDPDLSFMPFFFGIYLLQSSFLLLLIADKLRGEASESVVKACETIVRAHEACVVTLNTEYQRNFRKVMRSALTQVRGRMVEDFGEQQAKRREVLALYRWTGDGTGLAL